VSTISGHLTFYDPRTAAVGFIDDTGVVRLCFYKSYTDAWTFLGRLTRRGLTRTVADQCVDTMELGLGPAWVDYSPSTLSVTKRGLDLASAFHA
jgi:hypothetical protein